MTYAYTLPPDTREARKRRCEEQMLVPAPEAGLQSIEIVAA
jgi:hypothetical protein